MGSAHGHLQKKNTAATRPVMTVCYDGGSSTVISDTTATREDGRFLQRLIFLWGIDGATVSFSFQSVRILVSDLDYYSSILSGTIQLQG